MWGICEEWCTCLGGTIAGCVGFSLSHLVGGRGPRLGKCELNLRSLAAGLGFERLVLGVGGACWVVPAELIMTADDPSRPSECAITGRDEVDSALGWAVPTELAPMLDGFRGPLDGIPCEDACGSLGFWLG